MGCRNSSQYNEAFSLDFMGFHGIPQGFPVTKNRYKGISQFGHYNIVGVKGESPMSPCRPVKFKKRPCRPVEFRGLDPHLRDPGGFIVGFQFGSIRSS